MSNNMFAQMRSFSSANMGLGEVRCLYQGQEVQGAGLGLGFPQTTGSEGSGMGVAVSTGDTPRSAL